MAVEKGKKVLVTTSRRGVFAGRLVGTPTQEKTVLAEARCCLYWSSDTRGFLGLASAGPGEGCRIGPAAPKVTLYDVTSVVEMTDAAWERWEAEPWS